MLCMHVYSQKLKEQSRSEGDHYATHRSSAMTEEEQKVIGPMFKRSGMERKRHLALTLLIFAPCFFRLKITYAPTSFVFLSGEV
jgi:hypothetical protein